MKSANGEARNIGLQVPEQLAGKTSAQVIVTADGQASAPQAVQLAVVSPAIFTNGILNQNNSLNGATKPEKPGRVIQIFATGLSGNGLISAKIAGQIVNSPYYAGPAPGLPGVQQVDLLLPSELAGTVRVVVCGASAAKPDQLVCSAPASVIAQ